ncbi:MAG: cytochrome c oxidase subunit II transmembrane domain-containing protein [Phycisphaerales bacterium]
MASLSTHIVTLGAENLSWWERFWFRESGSTFADSTDAVYNYIFWVSAIFFIPIVGMVIGFGIKYRRSKVGEVAEVSPSHNTALELSWSVTPAILMAIMFFWGFKAYLSKLVAPVDAEPIYVTAYQWGWNFDYADGYSTNEFEEIAANPESPIIPVQVGKPYKMIMTSRDVIHSFYVPAFRIKRDIFPNRYTVLWFETTDRITHYFDEDDKSVVAIDPDRPGYYLFCAEYCGDQHSQMAGRIATLSPEDYNKWLEARKDTSGINLIELGELVARKNGCFQCHSVDGSAKQGPTWENLYGSEVPGWSPSAAVAEGATPGVAERGYIVESILYPNSYARPGFATGQMASYLGAVEGRELDAVVFYIKSLSGDFAAQAEQEAAAELEQQLSETEGDG